MYKWSQCIPAILSDMVHPAPLQCLQSLLGVAEHAPLAAGDPFEVGRWKDQQAPP